MSPLAPLPAATATPQPIVTPGLAPMAPPTGPLSAPVGTPTQTYLKDAGSLTSAVNGASALAHTTARFAANAPKTVAPLSPLKKALLAAVDAATKDDPNAAFGEVLSDPDHATTFADLMSGTLDWKAEFGPELSALVPQTALDAAMANPFEAGELIKAALTNAEFANSPVIAALLNDKTGIVGDTAAEDMLRWSIPLYLSRLPLRIKARIIAAQLKLPANASMEDRLLELLRKSGPAFKKLFQIFGKMLGSPTLREKLTELQDNIGAFPFEDVRSTVESELGRPLEEVFEAFDEEPVKSATVGQVHHALFKTPGGSIRPVAVKVQDPHYHEDMEAEIAIMRDIARNDFERKMIDKLHKIMLEEGDFRNEARNDINLAKDPRMLIVELAQGITPTKKLLVMNWVAAPTLKASRARDHATLVRQYRQLADLYEASLDRALSGDGFFHGDPHGGNLADEKSLGRFRFFDGGHCGRLAPGEATAFLHLAAAVATGKESLVMYALLAMPGVNSLSSQKRDSLAKEVRRELAMDVDQLHKMGAVFTAAANQGMEFSTGIASFQRAIMSFGVELTELKRRIEATGVWPHEKLMLKMRSPEAIGARAGFRKIRGDVRQGAKDFALDLKDFYALLSGGR